MLTDTNQPRRETKKDKITIAELSVGPVEEHGSQTWQQKLDIPPLPPSNLVNCGIIDLDYELKVRRFLSFTRGSGSTILNIFPGQRTCSHLYNLLSHWRFWT